MESADKEGPNTILYYGKKAYFLNPLIARQKSTRIEKVQCQYEDIEENGNNRLS
jgi:hypothetical protein